LSAARKHSGDVAVMIKKVFGMIYPLKPFVTVAMRSL